MSELQWALLVLAVAAVLGITWFSRSRSDEGRRRDPEAPEVSQMDLWKANGEIKGEFDEYGVSEPRTRGRAPEIDDQPSVSEEAPAATGSEASSTDPADASAALPSEPELIVSLMIAEREGTYILGPQIHRALARQSLEFGPRKIYYRLHEGRTVFAVASLLKPGELDPEQAADFSTPGLSVFMVLPCAVDAEQALEDMLSTSKALAEALHAQVYDERRQALNDTRIAELRERVREWAESAEPA